MEKWRLNQTALARELMVNPSYISRVLKGERVNLSERVLERLETIERRGPISKLPESQISSFQAKPSECGPRHLLAKARQLSGFTQAQLAKKIGYEIGVLQAIEDGSARISEKMAEAICREIPDLDLDQLLRGSDSPPTLAKDGSLFRTVGQKPNITLPDGMTARVIPLISWAQAGTMASFWDDDYQYEGIVAFDVTDRQAFAVALRGESMQPQYQEGDIAILCPNAQPRNGDLVIARLTEDAGDDVMFKLFTSSHAGRKIILSSYNPAFPPLEYTRADFRWIYPVESVTKKLRRS